VAVNEGHGIVLFKPQELLLATVCLAIQHGEPKGMLVASRCVAQEMSLHFKNGLSY
jgi:hypothetical protein